MAAKPWTYGPKELLEHARDHLAGTTAFDYRIAMISVDNAVELAIKTYLGLPIRVRGTAGPPRKVLQAAMGFPDLLDLLEKYGGDRLQGIELADIEWYHRVRNTLYHDGNGVTVDPQQVDAYNQIANLLFQNLFEASVTPETGPPAATILGEFVLKWAALETHIRSLAAKHLPKRTPAAHSALSLYDGLIAKGVATPTVRSKFEKLLQKRNAVLHGVMTLPASQLKELISAADEILGTLPPA